MQLNFETLHERRCLGVEAPGSDASDYEEWTPSDELRAGKCLLGRKVRAIFGLASISKVIMS